jgi:hypothetical protein
MDWSSPKRKEFCFLTAFGLELYQLFPGSLACWPVLQNFRLANPTITWAKTLPLSFSLSLPLCIYIYIYIYIYIHTHTHTYMHPHILMSYIMTHKICMLHIAYIKHSILKFYIQYFLLLQFLWRTLTNLRALVTSQMNSSTSPRSLHFLCYYVWVCVGHWEEEKSRSHNPPLAWCKIK